MQRPGRWWRILRIQARGIKRVRGRNKWLDHQRFPNVINRRARELNITGQGFGQGLQPICVSQDRLTIPWILRHDPIDAALPLPWLAIAAGRVQHVVAGCSLGHDKLRIERRLADDLTRHACTCEERRKSPHIRTLFVLTP